MNAQTIQTIAAVIQAGAAVVFLFSVAYDARERKNQRRYLAALKEQERRDHIIAALHQLWVQSCVRPGNTAMTDEELSGFHSARQIEFFNSKLRERGENWSYPFERV